MKEPRKTKLTVYYPGGYDPEKENNNIMYEVEVQEDPEIAELMEFEENLEILSQEIQNVDIKTVKQASLKIKELVERINTLQSVVLYLTRKRI